MCCVSLPTPASNCLLRQCCGPYRPFNIVVTDSEEREVCVFVCGGSGCGRWEVEVYMNVCDVESH